MKQISINEQKQIREAYHAHFQGQNWGLWERSKMPSISVGYQLLQYENNAGKICDVIKFNQKVQLEGHRVVGQSYHFQYKPNHNTFSFPSFETAPKHCKKCGEAKEQWHSSRMCSDCAEAASIPERENKFLERLKAHIEGNDPAFVINYKRINNESTPDMRKRILKILATSKIHWETFWQQSPRYLGATPPNPETYFTS